MFANRLYAFEVFRSVLPLLLGPVRNALYTDMEGLLNKIQQWRMCIDGVTFIMTDKMQFS